MISTESLNVVGPIENTMGTGLEDTDLIGPVVRLSVHPLKGHTVQIQSIMWGDTDTVWAIIQLMYLNTAATELHLQERLNIQMAMT